MPTRRAKAGIQRQLFGEPEIQGQDLRDKEHSRRGKAGQCVDAPLGECPDCGRGITKKHSIEGKCGQCFRWRAMGLVSGAE